ncbi:class I SAM-dependent methyltransferase [Nocardia sp. NPDC058058]|uniref:class I SAM-dependent methyltransferase n=1 Tax=Nocardia sp. NPDC058058 TaxID=3346317 RepID=UPI0036DF12EE
MQVGQPSRTALGAARARALHQTEEAASIFVDPFAAAIAGAADIAIGDGPQDRPVPEDARLFLAMRHRFAEDALAEVATEVKQVVILGAGLDTFAYRNPHPDLTVFEVDHPWTQQWKRQRLTDAGITVPDSVRFVPVDFETETLAAGLASAGFDRTVPAFFIWLGVVVYLTPGSVTATLRFIAEHSAPAQVVFDYSEPISALAPEHRPMVQGLTRLMDELGESWLSLFTVGEITAQLRALGFDEIEDFDRPGLFARFTPGRPTDDRVGGHILRAAHRGHPFVG